MAVVEVVTVAWTFDTMVAVTVAVLVFAVSRHEHTADAKPAAWPMKLLKTDS